MKKNKGKNLLIAGIVLQVVLKIIGFIPKVFESNITAMIYVNIMRVANIASLVLIIIGAVLLVKYSKGNTKEKEEEKEKASNSDKPKANMVISEKAQFAYNEKLAETKAGGINVDDVIEAKLFAQAVELQLLKAPATAKFCSLEEMTVTEAGEKYYVSGYVDSQNSYGAMVRTPFKLTVFKDNEGWKNADTIVSTDSVIKTNIFAHTLIWWILGILGSIITFCIYYFIIYSGF